MSVSRETSNLKHDNPLFNYIKIQSLIVKWIKSFEQTNGGARLLNVNLSLIPTLIFLLHEKFKRQIVCFVDPVYPVELINQEFTYIKNPVISCFPPITSSSNPTSPEVRFRQQAVEYLLCGKKSILICSKKSFNDLINISLDKNNHNKGIALSVGETQPITHLKSLLSLWKYENVDTTALPGHFTVRGCIFDVYQPSKKYPIRIEFDGNTIISIRHFDPITQISLENDHISNTRLFPLFENLTPNTSGISIKNLITNPYLSLNLELSAGKQIFNISPAKSDNNIFIDLSCISKTKPSSSLLATKELIAQDIDNFSVKVFISTETLVQEEYLKDRIGNKPIYFSSPYSDSFFSKNLGVSLYTYHHIVGKPKKRLSPWILSSKHKVSYSKIDDFSWNEVLVHENYGICRYRGLESIETSWGIKDCVALKFKDSGKVYVPTENISLVHKFVSSSRKAPQLSSLGSTQWEKQKQRSRKTAEKIVTEFISLYATRRNTSGFVFSRDTSLHYDLESSFPYEETGDQIKAWHKIKRDMETSIPMDRLLCGDVGFGKTEVSIRATFKACYDEKQVAILAPTTILANQHYLNFSERLSPYGITVELLSRFRTKDSQKALVNDLSGGKIGVVIGTHRLLSKDVKFFDLGLLIIDDEHRFGARHKEKIKHMKTSVDVLSMTATPIPRTLYLSLAGVRNISKIDTPPVERLPIITKIVRKSDKIISEAIMKEIRRNGQVFFIHNRVVNIDIITEKLQRLLPGVTFSYAHGQMDGRLLEKTMRNFLNRKFDVLVCTTIIEAGIDLPNVNTIIINNAHTFGLSQLYQIRGRVGRGNLQAYCYLLLPAHHCISTEAHSRLRTMENYSYLGAGYHISIKDMEIRGAGNIFGIEQSGHINSIGLHLFNKLVREEIAKQKNEPMAGRRDVHISVEGSSLIPNDYISDTSERLILYRRLGNVQSSEEVFSIGNEIRDRYGPMPQAVNSLLISSLVSVSSHHIGLNQINITSSGISAVFNRKDTTSKMLDDFTIIQDLILSKGVEHIFKEAKDNNIELKVNTNSLQDSLSITKYLFETDLKKA